MAYEFEEDSTESKIKQYMVAKDKSDALDKQIKTAAALLTNHTMETIHNLDDTQIELLLHQKWIMPVVTAIASIPDAVLDQLAKTVATLQAKYAVTFSEIEAGIRESEDSLTELIGQLTGDAYALQGLNEFVKAGKE